MFIGRWDEEELEALSKSVRRLTNTKKGVSVTSKIPWITVAQDIKTRIALYFRRQAQTARR